MIAGLLLQLQMLIQLALLDSLNLVEASEFKKIEEAAPKMLSTCFLKSAKASHL